jgi:ketosteroid isomerase-like protein
VGAAHPTDEQRAREALPVLERLLNAVDRRDFPTVTACHRDDVVWLSAEGTEHGPDAATAHYRRVSALARSWDPPQQHGAKAVLRWTGSETAGAIVVEVRGGLIMFAAEA